MRTPKRTIFITGAGRRLGRILTLGLRRDAKALLLHAYQSRDELLGLARTLRASRTPVFTYFADLRKPEEIGALLERLKGPPGPPEVVILNAASFLRKRFKETTMEEWDDVLSLNLRAPVVLADHLGRMMKAQGWGRIVIIGDTLGILPHRSYAVHSLAKAALIPAMRILAEELAPEVTVNMIAPGALLLPEEDSDQELRHIRERSLLKRLSEPQDVVEGVRFFIHRNSLTGAVIPVDGGRGIVPKTI